MYIDSILPIPNSKHFSSSLKFVLFVKNKEVSEINKTLNKIMLLPKIEQKAWRKEYGEMIDNALDMFVDDSNIVLSRLSLNDEVLELSHKLVTSLQEAMSLADNVLGPKPQLDS